MACLAISWHPLIRTKERDRGPSQTNRRQSWSSLVFVSSPSPLIAQETSRFRVAHHKASKKKQRVVDCSITSKKGFNKQER
mmetsp:Transcript_17058/g.35289  ORF Transcript_17058/g.35289 Transcript_17058/m.35289 type:complete len:81 (+) Transcript_17058:38-280(+)